MRMNKCAYLFAAALVASTVGMTSCSNEDVAGIEQGVENKVTLALSASGVSSRASSDEVNFGSTYQQIDNVVVVPMIGDAYQNPIKFGSFTPSTGATVVKATRTLSSNVNRFKVYGNVCDGYVTPAYSALSETSLFTSLTFKAPVWESEAPTDGTYSKPHELYYYYDTKGIGFKTSTQAWDGVEPSWGEPTENAIGKDVKSVKIGAVNYAVGVLAAMIKNGDTKTQFYTNEGCTEGGASFNNSLKVTGVIVYNQTESFDADFKASGTVNVYEKATDNAIKGSDDQSLSNENRLGGNIYSVVAPTTTDNVSLNIEFTVAEGVYFKLADGVTVMKPGDKLYLPVVLSKTNGTANEATNIFQADKATFLNAKVTNWGLGSTTPVEKADVTVGVEFDVTWGSGYLFNMDI